MKKIIISIIIGIIIILSGCMNNVISDEDLFTNSTNVITK